MSPNTSGGEPRNSGGGRVRTVRIGLGALGVAAIAYALAGAAGDPDIVPRRHAGFLLTVLVLHDAAVLPGFLLVGVLVRRLVGTRYRGIVQGALVVTAAVTLVALPLVLGYGRTADNPSALPRDYPAGLAFALGVVWTAAAVGLLATRVLRRRG